MSDNIFIKSIPKNPIGVFKLKEHEQQEKQHKEEQQEETTVHKIKVIVNQKFNDKQSRK